MTAPPETSSRKTILTCHLLGLLAVALPSTATATNHLLRMDEVMAGLNGDPTIQFIQMIVADSTQKAWGPQPGEPASRAMLVFFDGAGVETGRFFFPFNAPAGGNTVLIATANFAALPGAPVPDFLMPPLISPGSGKVCFRGNPANPGAFDVNLCLAYGSFPPALTEGAGLPAPALPITGDPISLTRFQNFGVGSATSRNADFTLASPTPVNTRGQTMTFAVEGPRIALIPNRVDFSPRNINTGPSASQTLTISNRGILNPLSITNLALTGANTNQFVIVTDTRQTNLPPGGTRTLTLTFNPTSPGTKTASVRITSNDTNAIVADVPLQGLGVDPNAPEIGINPLALNFGIVDLALGPTVPQNLIITNSGAIGTLIVSNITLVGPQANQFRIVTSTNQASLAPRASRTASVQFAPDSAGSKSAALRIVSSDTDEGVVDVALQGRAFDLNPCTAPNPTNSVAQDLCANAQLIGAGLAITGTVFGATADGSSSCGGAQPDVWFRYVPASDGALDVSVSGTGFAPTLSAHSGCPGTAANELACDNAGQRQPSAAEIEVPVTNGVPVFLRVAGVGNSNTTFQLMIEDGPASFDFDRNKNGITDSCEFDFGDAPAPYPTTLAADGARHRVFSGIFLGSRIDSNDDGLPTPLATGDNLDGQPNDEDGVTLTSPLIVGQTAVVQVAASASGFLNAWMDFNADGDWADPGEQILTNVALIAGVNTLTFAVPADATPTNLTFARYRFNSTGGLGVTGGANDGEVEDYAVEILPVSVTPGQLAVRISEVMAGLNGDATIQFVALEAAGDANKAWGPQGSEFAGRAMLVFFDETGSQSGRFVFPRNAPGGADTVLVATRAFADLTGVTPDFIMPPEVVPIAGKVSFQSNPDNLQFDINIALAYGGSGYSGLTDGAGPANTNDLPILHAKSLGRAQDVPFGLNQNGAFKLAAPTPRNTSGQTFSLSEAPIPDQGRTLFTRETFRGNGRTCATCHVAGNDQFSLTPASIAKLRKDDPLFVFKTNVNVLRLAGPSQPSDLRGPITGTRGSAKVLGGSGDTYFILGGTNLSGTIRDTNSNFSFFLFLSRGNLNGPTPGNSSTRGLEDAALLEQGRGLILENIDGFKRGEVFRAPPHLLNLAFTAPYGLSGEFNNLEDFCDGAVVQHLPRNLARVSGVDFRHPTTEELAAMSAFMLNISTTDTNRFNLDRLATTEAQKRGRALFFGDQGRCSKCHSGPVLALSDGTLPGSRKGVNENFDTGVANLLRNIADGLPTEPAGLAPGPSTRKFNTPPLFNVRLTAPFFRDGSASNLTEAVKFYDTPEFHNSPAGQQAGSLLAANKPALVADVVAFLESLVEIPVEYTRTLAFGIRCPGQPLPGPMTASITNVGSNVLTITNVLINGANAADFSVVGDTGETNLAPGQKRSLQIAFAPPTMGVKQATLEIMAVDTNLLGSFSFGVALSGADIDNLVTADPMSIDFGTRDIDAPPSPVASIVIANDGSTDLDISGLALTGATPADFIFVADTNPIAPHDIRVMEVSFAPRTQGAKSAIVRIPVVSCNGSLIEIPLAGVASSSVHHFAWDPLAATQFVGTPFPARITAADRNGETVQSFRGTVRLLSVVSTQTNTILISPTNSSPFVNGVWTGSVTVLQPSAQMRLLARDSQSHTGSSDAFVAPLRDDLSLTVTDAPDPVSGGGALTYTLLVQNTGPNDATGVVVSNTLSPGVVIASANADQGTLFQDSGVVMWTVGILGRAAIATATIGVAPNPPATNAAVTNIATVTRLEPEAVLTNNSVTNTTVIQPFGLLIVTPLTNFFSVGLSGGPFSPTNQTYVLSNAGTATLNWQATSRGCNVPDGLFGWWPLEGNASDVFGTNSGALLGSPVFTNGMVGRAMQFDGVDDAVRIPASPTLNANAGSGLTIEAWINPADVSSQQPLVEWDNGAATGTHLWISVSAAGGGPGSLFANIFSSDGAAHHVSSAPNLIQPNTWQHVAVTYNNNTGIAILYRNGTNIQQLNIGSFVPTTTGDLLLGRRSPIGFRGLIDEVSVYNRQLTETEIQAIFALGTAGKCGSGSSVPASPFNCASPASPIAWWTFDGDTTDVAGTNSGVLGGNVLFTNGFVGQALFFNGGNDGFRIPHTNALNIGTNAGMTFEAWFNVPDSGRRNPVFQWDNTTSFSGPFLFLAANAPGQLFVNLTDINDGVHQFVSGSGLFGANTWHHVAVTYNRSNGVGTIYLDGATVLQQNLGIFTPRTTGNLSIGRRGAVGFEESFQGLIDEPAVYGRELPESEIQSIFAAGAGGKCRNRSWFTQSPVSGTLAVGAITNVTVSVTTNASGLAVGTYSESISFTNTSNSRGTTQRVLTLAVVNRPPTLNSVAPLQVAEDSGSRTVNISGVTAGGREMQALSVTASSSKPALIADPITVNYASPATIGSLTFAPLPNANGTAVVSVVVRDDGGTENGGVDGMTNTFVVMVTPVNDPPALAPVASQTVNQGGLLTVTNVASDPDLPDDQLTFSLEDPPAGAIIDPASGVLTWVPGETQSPGTNLITVIVQDAGSPPLSATNRFTVTVLGSNAPPVLAPINSRTVHMDTPVAFTVVASDPDMPANILTFSLGVGAAAGAGINRTNGLFTWTASGVPIPSTNTFSVLVADDGAPPLSDQQTFNITVVARPVIQTVSVSNDVVTLGWSAISGTSYRVQFKAQLDDATWADLSGDVTANGNSATKTDNPDPAPQRFYRVQVLP